jgi:hypothetical protein
MPYNNRKDRLAKMEADFVYCLRKKPDDASFQRGMTLTMISEAYHAGEPIISFLARLAQKHAELIPGDQAASATDRNQIFSCDGCGASFENQLKLSGHGPRRCMKKKTLTLAD